MVQVGREDLVLALKRFKGIAKQEMLMNDPVELSQVRKTHAEARREIYARLIELVETVNIEEACVFAFSEYLKLPENVNDPALKGRHQALEMFFNVLGLDPEQLRTRSSEENIDIIQVVNSIQPSVDYCI